MRPAADRRRVVQADPRRRLVRPLSSCLDASVGLGRCRRPVILPDLRLGDPRRVHATSCRDAPGQIDGQRRLVRRAHAGQGEEPGIAAGHARNEQGRAPPLAQEDGAQINGGHVQFWQRLAPEAVAL
jgi:hypothetical protein